MTTTTTAHRLTPGSFVVSRWGYEQTTVEFYEVTHATAAFVWLRPVDSITEVDTAAMTYRAIPCPGCFTGETVRRKVYDQDRVRISSCARAQLWDGEPTWGSTYG